MNIPPGTHSVAGACPGCGEPVTARVSVRLYRDRGRNRWQTRARVINLGEPHECADADTYPLFPVIGANR